MIYYLLRDGLILTMPPITDEKVSNTMNSEEYVMEAIRSSVHKEMLFKEVLDEFQSKMDRLNNMEVAFIRKHYTSLVLELWLEESCLVTTEKLSSDLSGAWKLWDEINTIKTIEDVETTSWLSCKYRHLVVNQKDLFAPEALSYLVNQWQMRSLDDLTSKCFSARSKSQHVSEFFKSFAALLNEINRSIHRPQIFDKLKETSNSVNVFKTLIAQCSKYLPGSKLESFKALFLKSLTLDSYSEDLAQRIWRSRYSPETKVEIKKKDGRNILRVSGISVICSNAIEKMRSLLLSKNISVEEIHIVGFVAVHVDCSLPKDDWHGVNLVIVTKILQVHGEFTWDVSGQNSLKKVYETAAANGTEPGTDGQPGAKLK